MLVQIQSMSWFSQTEVVEEELWFRLYRLFKNMIVDEQKLFLNLEVNFIRFLYLLLNGSSGRWNGQGGVSF